MASILPMRVKRVKRFTTNGRAPMESPMISGTYRFKCYFKGPDQGPDQIPPMPLSDP